MIAAVSARPDTTQGSRVATHDPRKRSGIGLPLAEIAHAPSDRDRASSWPGEEHTGEHDEQQDEVGQPRCGRVVEEDDRFYQSEDGACGQCDRQRTHTGYECDGERS